jgi:hypothetical protein
MVLAWTLQVKWSTFVALLKSDDPQLQVYVANTMMHLAQNKDQQKTTFHQGVMQPPHFFTRFYIRYHLLVTTVICSDVHVCVGMHENGFVCIHDYLNHRYLIVESCLCWCRCAKGLVPSCR